MEDIQIYILRKQLNLVNYTLENLLKLKDKAKNELTEIQFINTISELEEVKSCILLELEILESVK